MKNEIKRRRQVAPKQALAARETSVDTLNSLPVYTSVYQSMPKSMPLSHLLMEHFDIPVGNKLDVRAASHTRTRKSVQRVYPCITSGSRFRWKQVDQEEGSIISRAQHVLAEARQWLSQCGRTPGHISGCCISTQFKWRILTAQVETAHIAERGMERGKLPHGCTLGHSLEVPLAAYDACNLNLGF